MPTYRLYLNIGFVKMYHSVTMVLIRSVNKLVHPVMYKNIFFAMVYQTAKMTAMKEFYCVKQKPTCLVSEGAVMELLVNHFLLHG